MELKATITAKGAIFEGKVPGITQKSLEGAMFEAVALLERGVKENIREAGRIGVSGAKGGLLSTIHGEVIQKGTPLIKGVIGTQSKYGEVIEKGRTAGKAYPPKDVLRRWIEVKLGITGEKELNRVEYLVRRKIGQKGFPGIHMFEKAWEESLPQIQGIFDNAGFIITRELNG